MIHEECACFLVFKQKLSKSLGRTISSDTWLHTSAAAQRQRSGSGGSGGSILTRTKLQLLSVRRRLHRGKIAAPLKIQLKNSSVQN